LWHSTQKEYPGLNFTGFEQVRADRALEEGRNELDNEKRVVHYREFQKAFMEQTPVIFLYHPFVHYNVTKYIEGIGEKYTFTYADRFLDFTNWKKIKTN
jgi:ABC-type transport system substrate-binding protein